MLTATYTAENCTQGNIILNVMPDNSKWMDYAEATLEIPYMVTSTTSSTMAQFKDNSALHIIDSIEVEYNDVNVVRQCSYVNSELVHRNVDLATPLDYLALMTPGVVIFKLKNLCSFFEQLPPVRCARIRIIIQYNACSGTILTDETGVQHTTNYVQKYGRTSPIKVGTPVDEPSNISFNILDGCCLSIPYSLTGPIAKIKTIYYDDVYTFDQFSIVPLKEFGFPVTYGINNPKDTFAIIHKKDYMKSFRDSVVTNGVDYEFTVSETIEGPCPISVTGINHLEDTITMICVVVFGRFARIRC